MPTSMPCFETCVPEIYEEAGFTPVEFGNLLDADADADGCALRAAFTGRPKQGASLLFWVHYPLAPALNPYALTALARPPPDGAR